MQDALQHALQDVGMDRVTVVPLAAVLMLIGWATSIPSQRTVAMADLVAACHRANLFHGTVLVTHRGREVFAQAVGTADADRDVPITLDTRFPIASLTKPFVAVLAMQAVERGELVLDQVIARYLPDYRRDHGDRVTIKHLLNHTSGIPYTLAIDRVPNGRWSRPQLLELLNKAGPLGYEPGNRFRYCNTGYRLLAMILEDLRSGSFDDVLESGILGPLGLENTGSITGSVATAGVARDHDRFLLGSEVRRRQQVPDMSSARGCGHLYSTVRDVAAFTRGFYSGQLVRAATQDTMRTAKVGSQGLGWKVPERSGHGDRTLRVISHGGGFAGYSCYVAAVPADDLVVVALGNVRFAPSEQLCWSLLDAFYGAEELPAPAWTGADFMADLRAGRRQEARARLRRARQGERRALAYGPGCATGEPDVDGKATYPRGWFPDDDDGALHWLRLQFPHSRPVERVRIHGTTGQRALYRMVAVTASGRRTELALAQGDAGPAVDGIAVTDFALDEPAEIAHLVLHFDTSLINGTNTVDAVALVDDHGTPTWAIQASASSRTLQVVRAMLAPGFPPSESDLERAVEHLLDAADVPTAVALAQISIDLEPDSPRAHATLGRALLRLGRVEEAIAAIEVATVLRPNSDRFAALLETAKSNR